MSKWSTKTLAVGMGLVMAVMAVPAARADEKPTHETVLAGVRDGWQRVTKLIEGVADGESAQKAAVELNKEAKELTALKKQAADLPATSEEEAKKLADKFHKDLQSLNDKFTAELKQVFERMKKAEVDPRDQLKVTTAVLEVTKELESMHRTAKSWMMLK